MEYNGNNVDVVNQFNYLGMVSNYNGKFLSTQKHCVIQGTKTLSSVVSKIKHFNVKTQISVFDFYVKSVPCYCAKIWVFIKVRFRKGTYYFFREFIHGVRKNTCKSAVYYEFGIISIEIFNNQNILKYWLKIRNMIYEKHVIMTWLWTMTYGFWIPKMNYTPKAWVTWMMVDERICYFRFNQYM